VILGMGIDFLETRRIERELARGEWRAGDGIFTPDEIRECQAAARPAGQFAACFAAKEAALKALGLPIHDLGVFCEVEVRPGGRIELHARAQAKSGQMGVENIKFSITHRAGQTGAVVILED
jgi:holo-[acyl-carrier protein] synthase